MSTLFWREEAVVWHYAKIWFEWGEDDPPHLLSGGFGGIEWLGHLVSLPGGSDRSEHPLSGLW